MNKLFVRIGSILIAAMMSFSLVACDEEGMSDGGSSLGGSTVEQGGASNGGSSNGGSSNGGTHVHAFSANWSSNATKHWHAATCGHGENKMYEGEHVDVDENGLCDVCAYEVGHTHTFEDAWEKDETSHWRKATCSHKSETTDVGLHVNEDGDTLCDVCDAHVHVVNQYGVCIDPDCGKMIKPVDNSLSSLVTAMLGAQGHVTGGTVNYLYSSESLSDSHTQEYSIGTNGTYTKRTDVGRADGKTYVLEDYIKKVSESEVSGVEVLTVDGVEERTQIVSFKPDHLKGYYYSVSSLAYAYGAEQILAATYDKMDFEGTTDITVDIDEDNRAGEFSYNTLTVNAIETTPRDEEGNVIGPSDYTYNVHYYEVSVEFAYDENYTLTDLKITCNCYTNDAGKASDGTLFPTDFIYYPATNSITFNDNASPDTYTYTVKQTTGTRTELDLENGDEKTPLSVVFYSDKACTQVLETVKITKGETSIVYIGCEPAGTDLDMLGISIDKTVTNSAGTKVYGVCTLGNKNELTFNPYGTLEVGTYNCLFDWGKGVTKEFTLIVEEDTVLQGSKYINYSSATANSWTSTPYQLNLETFGTFTFYVPDGVTMAVYGSLVDGAPAAEDLDCFKLVGTADGGVKVYTLEIEAAAYIGLRINVAEANKVYVIGYDEP